MGWLILAWGVVLVAAMVASYLVAMSQSRSTIQATKDLLSACRQETQTAREIQAQTRQAIDLDARMEKIESTLDKLDTTMGEALVRLSEGGHLRTRGAPEPANPRGSWGGGETSRSGTRA